MATFVESLGQLFYYQLRVIQAVEKQSRRGIIPGLAKVQASSGHLICDVGIVNALDATRDPVFSLNRAHLHGFIRVDDVDLFIDNAMVHHKHPGGQSSSWSPDPATLCRPACNEEDLIVSVLQSAVASKESKSDAVSVAFLGDTPTARRNVLHGIHAATWWSLPILFVINHSTPPSKGQYELQLPTEQPGRSANGRPSSLRSIVADDVFKVYAFASAAIAYVRSTKRPFLLQLDPPCSNGRLRTHADASPEKGSWGIHDALRKVAQKLSPLEQETIDVVVARRLESILQHTS